jgi:hypothetical protein
MISRRPPHITIRHIPYDGAVYAARLQCLEDHCGGRSSDLFEDDPLDLLSSGQLPPECGRILGAPERNEPTAEWAEAYLTFCSMVNCIDWIVDQLLDATDESSRHRLANVPVRVVDTNALTIAARCSESKYWIVIDRSLHSFFQYMSRLLFVELFRPASEEFLSAPPSHEEVVRLVREAGRLYRRGEWSEAMRPISKMHFRQAINWNATSTTLGVKGGQKA